MSTPATETPARSSGATSRRTGEARPQPGQAQGKGLQKKYGPLPAWAWVAVAAAGAVVLFVWWRNRSSSSATSTAGQCYDSNGNIVPCPSGGDTGALSETEYESLLAAIKDLQGNPSTGTTGNKYYAITTKETLLNLAHEYGLTESQLVALNPQLVQYDKPKTDVPAGLQIIIGPPPATPAALNSPGSGTLAGASTTSSGSTTTTSGDDDSAAPALNPGGTVKRTPPGPPKKLIPPKK